MIGLSTGNKLMKFSVLNVCARYGLAAFALFCALFVKAQSVNSTMSDPYLWLEEVQGEKALAWVRERNALSTSKLQVSPVFSDNRAKVLGVLNNRDQIPGVTRRGEHLYNFWRDAQNPGGCGVAPRWLSTGKRNLSGTGCLTWMRWAKPRVRTGCGLGLTAWHLITNIA